MSLLSQLAHLVSAAAHPRSDSHGPEAAEEDALATAALLVHVARIDGRFDPREREALASILQTGFGLTEAATQRLIARGDRLNLETDDLSGLIDMMGHTLGEADRRRLLAMANRIAKADGQVQEFESDLIWRLGHLLAFDEAEIAAILAEPPLKPTSTSRTS